MPKNIAPQMIISMFYVPGASGGGQVPDIGSVTLDQDTSPRDAMPITAENLAELSKNGLQHLGKIEVLLMDTVEEARAVGLGMRESPNKQAAAYQNAYGFGLVLTCEPAKEPGIELIDHRKPAIEIGAVEDRVFGSWNLSKKQYEERSMPDEEIELQVHRFGKRLAKMAESVGMEAIHELREATDDAMLEDELRFAQVAAPGM
ncbi:hypothetical protein [Salipiger mucosus]|uniref:Uncharacterized protein n=1 Tax=Salipiger mucosus DSM 16094 TaxID=1123237 RepID=S9Q9Q2_9RHOB|nr:hypothetical protein [Salipiger mucosus]EPX78081.1 hypothetical protein Salmuc_03403 [Salipiger mucosus DSM 16094]